MTPYYQDEWATIYHGDSVGMLPELKDNDIKLVLSDPPYGINHPTDYRRRGRSGLAQCSDYAPVAGDDKPFDPTPWLEWPAILWGANYFAHRLPPASGWMVWDKERPANLDQSTAELAWTSMVKGVRVFRHLWHGMMRASERKENYHPTQKPSALMAWCLGHRWVPEGLVLDPYMGAGPVLVAAKAAGRKAIGIEIEEKYCEIAANRLRQGVLWPA